MTNSHTGTVALAESAASSILYKVLRETAREFADDFAAVPLPGSAAEFRKSYPRHLPAFEAARAASGNREAIAAHAVNGLRDHIVWTSPDGATPYHHNLDGSGPALPLQTHSFANQPGWQPEVVYRGERWRADQLSELGSTLVERGVITPEAGSALSWIQHEALDANGAVHLPGRKIAVLGGGAEMAPTRSWLEAGADVLWLDVVPPPGEWFESTSIAGRLSWAPGNADILKQPREILATLIAFAAGDSLDLGLYAYAPGQARELRLTAAMNEIVNKLPAELVGSVTILVSPTTPTALSAHDLSVMQERLDARPGWQAPLDALGLLGRGGGSARVDDGAAPRSVVSIQGASYQAAQYLGKVLTAETWAAQGMRVSANTAAITRTRSLDHPVFAAAFGGAGPFGVETATPRLSRRLNGMLALHDWLNPATPVPGRIRVHGGIHTLPYPLEQSLRVAAAIGFARSPRLLRGLLPGRQR